MPAIQQAGSPIARSDEHRVSLTNSPINDAYDVHVAGMRRWDVCEIATRYADIYHYTLFLGEQSGQACKSSFHGNVAGRFVQRMLKLTGLCMKIIKCAQCWVTCKHGSLRTWPHPRSVKSMGCVLQAGVQQPHACREHAAST